MQLNNAVIHSTRKKGNVFSQNGTSSMFIHLACHFSKLFIWRPPPAHWAHDPHLGFLTCRPAWLWNYGFDLGRSSNEAFRKMIFIRHLNINRKQLGYIYSIFSVQNYIIIHIHIIHIIHINVGVALLHFTFIQLSNG